MNKTLIVEIAGIALCGVVLFIANTAQVFGKTISRVLPCKDAPASSFPCYARYDIAIGAVAAIVGVILLIKVIGEVRR